MSPSSSGQPDLVETLRPLVDSGRIVINQSDASWFELLRGCFPTGLSGICWEQIPSARSRSVEHPRRPISDKAAEIEAFLTEFAAAAGLGPDDKCVVVGDALTSVAFEMSVSTLLECFVTLFSEPQGVYVLKPDGSWCFAFTFAEDMYYARSPFTDPKTDAHR